MEKTPTNHADLQIVADHRAGPLRRVIGRPVPWVSPLPMFCPGEADTPTP